MPHKMLYAWKMLNERCVHLDWIHLCCIARKCQDHSFQTKNFWFMNVFIWKILLKTKCIRKWRRWFNSGYYNTESHSDVKINVSWQDGFTLDFKGREDKLQVGWCRVRIVLLLEEISASWTGNVYLYVPIVSERQTILILITHETKNGKLEGRLCLVLS